MTPQSRVERTPKKKVTSSKAARLEELKRDNMTMVVRFRVTPEQFDLIKQAVREDNARAAAALAARGLSPSAFKMHGPSEWARNVVMSAAVNLVYTGEIAEEAAAAERQRKKLPEQDPD